jgi:hypothetical protein
VERTPYPCASCSSVRQQSPGSYVVHTAHGAGRAAPHSSKQCKVMESFAPSSAHVVLNGPVGCSEGSAGLLSASTVPFSHGHKDQHLSSTIDTAIANCDTFACSPPTNSVLHHHPLATLAVSTPSPPRHALQATVTAAITAPSHLHIMGFYGFDPDMQHGWTNLGFEGPAALKVYAKNK